MNTYVVKERIFRNPGGELVDEFGVQAGATLVAAPGDEFNIDVARDMGITGGTPAAAAVHVPGLTSLEATLKANVARARAQGREAAVAGLAPAAASEARLRAAEALAQARASVTAVEAAGGAVNAGLLASLEDLASADASPAATVKGPKAATTKQAPRPKDKQAATPPNKTPAAAPAAAPADAGAQVVADAPDASTPAATPEPAAAPPA